MEEIRNSTAAPQISLKTFPEEPEADDVDACRKTVTTDFRLRYHLLIKKYSVWFSTSIYLSKVTCIHTHKHTRSQGNSSPTIARAKRIGQKPIHS